MHLRDINIEGFKSYSEKTSMSFQPGIGVIIGNNGVGKSNILDAIVWALGEDDINRVRCYDEEELFFSGSKNYPPASRIRIEMSFMSGEGKDDPFHNLIWIVREKSKKGEDKYWIGGQPYSKRDYRQKLNDLDLKHSLRTIIRQEQINDILMLNPWERFSMIQSLLGIYSAKAFSKALYDSISPLFERYMAYLMPRGEVKFDIISKNGKNGLEIEVNLPGNRLRKTHQLSGGEKSVTSLALKLAVFSMLQSPFFLLDEVEPSLDYTNHKSMQVFLKDVAKNKQLIMITHLRSTIDLASTLHGVRTRWDGSSFMKFYFLMNKKLLRLYKCC